MSEYLVGVFTILLGTLTAGWVAWKAFRLLDHFDVPPPPPPE